MGSDKGRGRPDCIVMGKCGLGYFDRTRGNAGRVKSPKVAFELAKACDARGTPFKHGFVDRRDFNHKKREYNFDKYSCKVCLPRRPRSPPYCPPQRKPRAESALE